MLMLLDMCRNENKHESDVANEYICAHLWFLLAALCMSSQVILYSKLVAMNMIIISIGW